MDQAQDIAGEPARAARIRGLDSIRFIAAAIVMFAHTGQPPLRVGIDTHTLAGRALDGLLGNTSSSAAAVIAFFVISGFCIHYAHAGNNQIRSLSEYYARRYIRILIPALAALAGAAVLHLEMSLFDKSILWSVAAEIIYYTLYPLLLLARRKAGSWLPLIAVSFVFSVMVAATNPLSGAYPVFGLKLNWLLALPCWLLGCWLADLQTAGRTAWAEKWLWPLRGATWATMVVCSVLRYHSPIGYPWTLNLFAILVTFWLMAELAHFSKARPVGWLEWAGGWSYSLYLTHKLTFILLGPLYLQGLGLIPGWTIQLALLLAGAYVFYLAIERPSHHLARIVGRRLASLRPAAAANPAE
ncbi:peptidoglycan/LPS O-acetylase OafA/YrhL [Caulobacter ginsengisoli]|uniref:Peptidoglycan/LPS O-acetylase OafA/YrhL n=1 Tax=Caulobacter ginsengisoli TaxID=400775 RepID=A0ABU0INZ4_9CAUL|nr:acyltransferase [Caulobacter ginsengisoli]MDQ0463126.1 peptidoglycan/LPS O-acetylase OafA/YrhL [Caulobacter ginsengisoli]